MGGLRSPSTSSPEGRPAIRRTTDGPGGADSLAGALLFGLVLVLVVADLAEDTAEGVTWSHVLIEGGIALGATAGLTFAVRRLVAQRRAARAQARAASLEAADADARAEIARQDAASAREDALTAQAESDAAARRAEAAEAALARSERLRQEAEQFRTDTRDATGALSAAIAERLRAWELTPAERDVARLLLLGLSHKEIAQARETSERTARDQAQAVYKKAGVQGRAELAAFFLEDLLPPAEDAAASRSSSPPAPR